MGWILDGIASFFFGILLFLDSIVYSLINWIYQIILLLCQIDILDNTFEIDALINRVYVIIGVVVLFLLAYSLLKSMVNPDDALKGKKSPVTIIKDVLISIVLIALVPTIFSFAMDFQTAILQENTIGKIILGTTSILEVDDNGNPVIEEDSGTVIEDGGAAIASNVLHAFLHPNYERCNVDENSITGYDCSNITVNVEAYGVSTSMPFDNFWKITVEKGSFSSISSLTDAIVDGNVTYYFLISTAAGIFVFIILLSYCFDIALRLVKLAVFQLIAPLPILSRIAPTEQGGKVFSNWLKATISTYVEVFIRLAILFFAVLLIKIVIQNFTSIFAPFVSGTDAWTVVLFAQLFVIIGIILFIKQAPQILKDITGLDSGKYNVLGSAMRGLSSIGALGTGTVRGFTTGFDKNHIPSSIGRGLKNAFASGAKSFTGAAQKEYKGIGDIKKNAHASVEEVINRQRQRQANKDAEKRDLKAYRDTMTQGEHEPDFIYKVRHSKPITSLTKGAKDTAAGIKEWAGVSGSDPATDNRTKEAINAIGSLVGSMQDVWKKDPGFIKAKEEANNAEALFNAVNKDYQEMLDKGVSATDAEQQILQKYQMSKDEAKRRMDVAKSIQKSQERTLQTSASKVNQIAGKIVELQKTQDRYGDVDIVRNIQSALEIQISDEAERNRIMQSVKSYGDLSNVRNYDRFITDLKNGNQSAIDVLDAYDKLDITGKRELTNISGREIERQNNQKKKDEK